MLVSFLVSLCPFPISPTLLPPALTAMWQNVTLSPVLFLQTQRTWVNSRTKASLLCISAEEPSNRPKSTTSSAMSSRPRFSHNPRFAPSAMSLSGMVTQHFTPKLQVMHSVASSWSTRSGMPLLGEVCQNRYHLRVSSGLTWIEKAQRVWLYRTFSSYNSCRARKPASLGKVPRTSVSN